MPVQVDLEESPRRFTWRGSKEIVAGEDSLTLKFPQAVPVGKKAVVSIEVRAELRDA